MSYIDDYLKEHLSEKRIRHTYGVVDEAVKLANKYGADPEKAKKAALYHDLFRHVEGKELENICLNYDLPDKYFDNPNLAHSKVASIKIREIFGERDQDVIAAVSFHTTGRAGMSTLEKVIYLADAIEPNRDYPGVDEIRRLSEENLDEACLYAMKHSVEYVKAQGGYVDEDTISAIEYYDLQGDNI